jgi:hypothetical protein
MHERLRNYVDGKATATLPGDRELRAYGVLLFETLFPGDVRRLYETARSSAGPARLDVVFTSMIPWIADKPWEFAFDPVRKAFLTTDEIHFARNVLTAIPAEGVPTRPPPIRIFVVTAQPLGHTALSVDDEVAVVRRGFEPLRKAGAAAIEVRARATAANLEAGVKGGADIVHFIGHGDYDPRTQEGRLLFEDGEGKPRPLDGGTLRDILCRRGVRLLFLNACETGRGGRSDFNRGVAPALVAAGLPAVVANQYKVLDASATAFARHFYRALAQGRTLAEAARESRSAVRGSIAGESIDWAVPVLYARDPRARLCDPGVLAPAAGPARVRPGPRAPAAPGVYRVGVWDIDGALPHLEDTLERMNAAQDRFAFRLADLHAPLGSWRGARGQRLSRLYIDRLSRALGRGADDLGLDALAGISGRPVVLGHGPRPRQALMIVSTAAFDVPGEGCGAERALVRTVVGAVAGRLAGIESHPRPPESCPLFGGARSGPAALARPLRFDATCRARLHRALVARSGAPEARKRMDALHLLLTLTDR